MAIARKNTCQQDAFSALQLVLGRSDASTQAIDHAFQLCSDVVPDAEFPHTVYRDIGQLALDNQRLDVAEAFAIRSLKSLPRYGAALKLLGLIFRAAGRLDDAAICHRYGLPESVKNQWFGDTPCIFIRSNQVNDECLLRTVAFPHHVVPLKPPVQWRPQEIDELSVDALNVTEGYTVAVPDGALWFDSFNSVLWDASGRIVQDVSRGFAEVVHGSLDGRKPHRLCGTVALLGNRNANNYYHWMNDVLPRLAVLENSGYPLDSIDHFVLGELQHEFQIESLRALNIDTDRLHFYESNNYVCASNVLLATYGANSLGKSQGRWNPEFLNQVFAPARKAAPSLRLYVSRGRTGARGIVNEAELIDFLSLSGFQVVIAENMTIRQQASLFSIASVVLGPHGAGLSNIAFCQPGTRVIELFSSHIAPCFWSISEVMELEHYVHFCGEVDESSLPVNNEEYHRSADKRRVSPFTVNVQEIEQVLKHAGVV